MSFIHQSHKGANFWLIWLIDGVDCTTLPLDSWHTEDHEALRKCSRLLLKNVWYHILFRRSHSHCRTLHRTPLTSWRHRQLGEQHPLAPCSWGRWSSSWASRRYILCGTCACRAGTAPGHQPGTLSYRSHILYSSYSHQKFLWEDAVSAQFFGQF